MNKKQRTMMLILVIALVIGLGSITYAYWTANTENKISTNTTIQTGVLKLVLDDGTNKDGVLTGTIDPNNTKFTTYLSITNEGTYDTFAKLYFKGLINTFSSDLVYSIEEVDSLPSSGSEPKIVKRIKYQVPVPGSLTSSRELLADGLLIKMGTLNGNNLTPNTEYYRVTVEYLYSDTVNQSSDMGKSFYTGFDIEQGDKLTETIVMIDNIEQLVELVNEVNAGDSKSGKEYRLMRNLDFNDDDSYLDATETKYGDINKNGTIESIKTELTTGAGWTPIGTEAHPYSGDFNGQGYEIQHLYINNNDVNVNRIGLFGAVTDGIINNLGVKDINISTTVASYIGGLIGIAQNSTISNCHNAVTNRENNTINIRSTILKNYVGGLVGYVYGNSFTINNSYNEAKINGGKGWNGGIIGATLDSSTIININNCKNYGNIEGAIDASDNTISGGIIGIIWGTSKNNIINNCYNEGSISNSIFIGGIVGDIGSTNISITNCENNGALFTNYTSSTRGSNVGGIVGCFFGGNIVFDKCSNKQDITINSGINYALPGGIIGATTSDYGQTNISILNSSNNGKITSGTIYNSAGLIGCTDFESSPTGSNIKIYNSYNSGNVTTTYRASGITIATIAATNITLNNVYNIGNINTTVSNNKAGLILTVESTAVLSINNSYYLNNVSGVGTPMSLSDMTSSSFATTLNNNRSSITLPSELNGYTLSTWCTSDNGPVLDYQVPESERSTRCPAYN